MFIKEIVKEKITKLYNYLKSLILFTSSVRIGILVSALYYIINNTLIWYKSTSSKSNIEKNYQAKQKVKGLFD